MMSSRHSSKQQIDGKNNRPGAIVVPSQSKKHNNRHNCPLKKLSKLESAPNKLFPQQNLLVKLAINTAQTKVKISKNESPKCKLGRISSYFLGRISRISKLKLKSVKMCPLNVSWVVFRKSLTSNNRISPILTFVGGAIITINLFLIN